MIFMLISELEVDWHKYSALCGQQHYAAIHCLH